MKKKINLRIIVKALSPYLYEKLRLINRSRLILRLKQNYPNIKIFDKQVPKLYSQENQDYIIWNNFFKDLEGGFFCDIGGNHPLNFNNTRYLEENGWTGFVFEPLPSMKPLWEKHRTAKLFPFAASDTEGETSFSIVSDTEKHGDMFSFIKDTKDSRHDYVSTDITVTTKLLKDVFQKEGVINIDYMSIDVEGHELKVIKGIDFDHTRINVLTIENNPIDAYIYGDEKIRQVMFDHGYILWGRIIGLDDIFVHKDFIK